jgi:hypothetical protein
MYSKFRQKKITNRGKKSVHNFACKQQIYCGKFKDAINLI